MNKTSYYLISTVSFALILFELLLAYLTQQRVPLLTSLMRGVGIFIPLYIAASQFGYSRRPVIRGIGWFLCFVVLVGGLFKIMHWPLANDLLLYGGGPLVLLMFASAILEGTVNVLEYLLILYVACRIFRIFRWLPEVIFWLELMVVPGIVVAGIVTLLLRHRQERTKIGNL